MTQDFYVFKDAVNAAGGLSVTEPKEGLIKVAFTDKEAYIRTSSIPAGGTAVVIFNPLTLDMFTLYNFGEIAQVMGLTHSEVLRTCGVCCFMQADRVADGRLFVKTFLPKGQLHLDGYAEALHITRDCVHPIDWHYQPTLDAIRAELKGQELSIACVVCKQEKDDVFINYAGQAVKAKGGELMQLLFNYVPGENLYIGPQHSRCKGAMVDVGRLLIQCLKS